VAVALALPLTGAAAAHGSPTPHLTVDVTTVKGALAFQRFLAAHNGAVVQLDVRCDYFDTIRSSADKLPASTHCYAGLDKGKINWVVFSVFTGKVSTRTWWSSMLGQDVAGETWAGFPATGRFVKHGTAIEATGRFRVRLHAAGVGAGSDVSVALSPA
jgi:hypothetical protein